MSTKHTPGPWEVKPEEVDREYIRIRGTIPGCRFKIANVCARKMETSQEWAERETNEARANARLIAAAPRLLAELEKARDYVEMRLLCKITLEERDRVSNQLATIDAAIAEAKGEET